MFYVQRYNFDLCLIKSFSVSHMIQERNVKMSNCKPQTVDFSVWIFEPKSKIQFFKFAFDMTCSTGNFKEGTSNYMNSSWFFLKQTISLLLIQWYLNFHTKYWGGYISKQGFQFTKFKLLMPFFASILLRPQHMWHTYTHSLLVFLSLPLPFSCPDVPKTVGKRLTMLLVQKGHIRVNM